MCQLLGICANREVDINLSLREFHHRGKENYHGWGFAFLENNAWKVIKKPSSLEYENIKEKIFQFKSKIIIGHVRLASCGKQVHHNTHPFSISNWTFAHNGTVTKVKTLALHKFKPEGETDSEYAFCYLLEQIQGISFPELVDILENESKKIREYGNFNFLMSDGKKLFAYGDDRLYYVKRKAPFEFVRLKDDQYEVHLAEIKAPNEKAIIVATEPLTENEKWERIFGLKIFENGEEFDLLSSS